MFQTLHLMQSQQYDPAFRPLLQPNPSGFGTLTGPNGVTPQHQYPHMAPSPAVTTATAFYSLSQQPPPPPPPPDQPLPPLPPVTPTSGMSGVTHQGRPSSTVNPYAASSAVSLLPMNGTGNVGTMAGSTHTGKCTNEPSGLWRKECLLA